MFRNNLLTSTLRFARFFVYPVMVSLSGWSCKRLVEIPLPAASITSSGVFATDANSISAVTGIYSQIMASGLTSGPLAASVFPGLSADELAVYGTNVLYSPYYINALSSTSSTDIFWENLYPLIFNVNEAVGGLNGSTTLTPAIQRQLLGECKFMRGFFYFYLTNLYGDVPLVTSTDYSTTASISRTPQAQVYGQIIADLKSADSLLSPNFLDGTLLNTSIQRVRPTKWAAEALLSRVYLYTGDWIDGETMATAVINQSGLFQLQALTSVFLANSGEAIWQLQPVSLVGQNTPDAVLFVLPSVGPDPNNFPLYLNNDLVNAFEPGDGRRAAWVDSVIVSGITYYYPFKYEQNLPTSETEEYDMVLRLGEMFLIRAECRAQQGNLTGAAADIDTIRSRAGLTATAAGTKADLLTAAYQERRQELFTEWGHRWLDLKRDGLINTVMDTAAPKKGATWAPFKALYPVPLSEIKLNSKLSQNEGY